MSLTDTLAGIVGAAHVITDPDVLDGRPSGCATSVTSIPSSGASTSEPARHWPRCSERQPPRV
jgi:hypothetical protein